MIVLSYKSKNTYGQILVGGGERETHALSLFSSNRTVARFLKQTPLYCSAPVPFKTISWSVHRTWFDLICNIYLSTLRQRNKSVIVRGYLLLEYLYTFQSYTKNVYPCRLFYEFRHFLPYLYFVPFSLNGPDYALTSFYILKRCTYCLVSEKDTVLGNQRQIVIKQPTK